MNKKYLLEKLIELERDFSEYRIEQTLIQQRYKALCNKQYREIVKLQKQYDELIKKVGD